MPFAILSFLGLLVFVAATIYCWKEWTRTSDKQFFWTSGVCALLALLVGHEIIWIAFASLTMLAGIGAIFFLAWHWAREKNEQA